MRIWSRKIKVKKSHKNRFGEGLGPLLGRGLGGLGRLLGGVWVVWGVSWALLGASWLVFGRSKSSFFSTWAQDGLQEAFWIDLGSILGGFGESLGRDLEEFGSLVRGSWGKLGRSGESWGKVRKSGESARCAFRSPARSGLQAPPCHRPLPSIFVFVPFFPVCFSIFC